eukprot:CAMPEP_0180713426 /NCGR_PEP_ID=MMETSP1038_2-20121128/11888_1 /TAXON_ID=632150 /ORGANISM="Azadinium spinosum, Strain 3D9" /LENGTH=48 /DNA_ID= /DNA_START= /DNA_END= /DNA_ORIENTATION=
MRQCTACCAGPISLAGAEYTQKKDVASSGILAIFRWNSGKVTGLPGDM